MAAGEGDRPGSRADQTPTVRRVREVLRRFEALSPGESVEVAVGRSGEALLRLLQRSYPGQFEWHPLSEDGAARLRRVSEEGPTPVRVLTQEHAFIAQLLAELWARLELRQWPGAQVRWRAAALWIDRHGRMVAPLLALGRERLALPLWLTRRLLGDHLRLARLGEAVGQAIAGEDAHAARAALADLEEAVETHCALEAQALFPLLETTFAERELAFRMQAT